MMHASLFVSCRYLILFSLLSHLSASAIITVPPVSVTAPPFTTATYTCEGTGDILNWWIQSTPLTDSIKQQRQITVTTTNTSNTNFSSVLTVNALPINDGLGIGCEVITFNPFQRVTSSSSLTIRGISSVEDIQYSFPTNNSLLIRWSPPVYYSNDVPIDHSPVSYQVLVTDEEDGDIILDTITSNTNIEVANFTQCDTFNISVTALVYIYTSNINTISNYGSYRVNVTGDGLHHSVSIEASSMPSPYCERKLFVKDESDGSILVCDETLSVDYKNITLKPHKKYRLSTEVKNLMDKVKDTKYTIISTYNVQDLLVSIEGNGSVSVQCVFVSGSTADGCHVIFTDTINGRNEYFNITGSDNTIISLSTSGNYTLTVYDIINGWFYGPAVQYPTLVEIIKVTPSTSTSSSIMTQSTSTTQSTVTNNVSPTITDTPGTGTTSSTSEKDNNHIVPIVAGTVSVIVLVILIILTICVSIIVNKRKGMKVQVLIRSEFATCQQPQAETNPYQEVHLTINEVPIATGSPVQLTNNRPIDDENPYHVTMSEFLTDNHTIPLHDAEGLMPQQPRPSLASTTTQETTLEESISSNNIHDNEYTTEPNANDTITFAVNDTNTTTTVNVTADTTVTNTDPATATYAVIDKRTDATVPPASVQPVIYNNITGAINKRGGGVTVYPSDDILTPPPPPSYADTVAQEHGTTVSSSQFKVPVQVTDINAAGTHEKYETYPPTNTGDEYGINTPVQDQSNSTDAEAVHVHVWSGASFPSNEGNDAG